MTDYFTAEQVYQSLKEENVFAAPPTTATDSGKGGES